MSRDWADECERLTNRAVTAEQERERLRAWAEDEQRGRHKAEEDRMNARSEIERLRADHDELLTKAMGVEAERDLAWAEIDRLRSGIVKQAMEIRKLMAVLKLAQDWARDPNRSAVSIDGFPMDDVDAAFVYPEQTTKWVLINQYDCQCAELFDSYNEASVYLLRTVPNDAQATYRIVRRALEQNAPLVHVGDDGPHQGPRAECPICQNASEPYCPFCKKRHAGGDTCMGHHP